MVSDVVIRAGPLVRVRLRVLEVVRDSLVLELAHPLLGGLLGCRSEVSQGFPCVLDHIREVLVFGA